MKRSFAALACLAVVAGAAQTAHAQAKPPTALERMPGARAPGTVPGSSVPGDPSGTSPGPVDRQAPPETVAPSQPQAGNTESLSTRLSQTNGALTPPAVDPGMQKTPTQPGTMPVIPPPGTAGGAPGAVAK
jgi:hypothetical protein